MIHGSCLPAIRGPNGQGGIIDLFIASSYLGSTSKSGKTSFMGDRGLPTIEAEKALSRFRDYFERNFKIDGREWEITREDVVPELLAKNDYFVREGVVCRKLAFIAEGVMRYTRFEESGDETTCYFCAEEDFVGDPESFDTQKPSDKNLMAITDCQLVSLPYDAVRNLARALPRFREIMAAIDRTTTMNLLHQRDFLINRDAASRYQYFLEHYPHILSRVPLGHVASFLDITQQSLSRLRKQLS